MGSVAKIGENFIPEYITIPKKWKSHTAIRQTTGRKYISGGGGRSAYK